MNYTFLILLFITACVPVQNNNTAVKSTSSTIYFTNKIFDSNIKTVQLYPDNGNILDQTIAPVIPLSKNNLLLEFDELVENANSYKVKIYNCTYDWKKTKLNSIEYLYDYNEFDEFNYDYSLDTDFTYVHYRFKVPKVKIAGNYVIVVYRNNNEDDILLIQRFMVYDNKVEISHAQSLNSLNNLTRKNQRIEFFIRYKNYAIDNPRTSINVRLRQNNQWNNVIHGIQATYIREDIQELEYRFYDPASFMKGGNEFRFFDFRSINHPGYRVDKLIRENNNFTLQVAKDKIRSDLAYAQYKDKNGKFYIYNQDFGNSSSTSNYVHVKFSLSDTKIPLNSEIYLYGALTNYELIPDHLLTHNANNKTYDLDIILKQGHYDYQYYSKNDTLNYNYIEGDYFETENNYEILVYHRPFGSKTDLLIGYKSL